MQNKIPYLFCLIGIYALLSGCATLQDGRIVLQHCSNIILPGSYVLTKNLSATSDCIRINADYVTLDLNGFTITGNGNGTGITTLDANRKRINIYNGNVTNFENGIELRNIRDVIIEKVRTTNNSSHGIFAGINAPGGANNIIRDCIAIDNDGTDIVTNAILINNVVDRVVAANSVSIGNKFEYMDADHGSVINNVGDHLFVGNCPTMIMGNNLKQLTSADPPDVFTADCKVINNIPSDLTSP
jgi:hypothetical protein